MSPMEPENVTQEKLGDPAGPCAMVIFGAGGDLTKRKLIPALYNLAKGKLLPDQFAIIGVSNEPYSTDEFRQRMTQDIAEYFRRWRGHDIMGLVRQAPLLHFRRFQRLRSFTRSLAELLGQVEKEQGTQGNAFSISRPARFFSRSS